MANKESEIEAFERIFRPDLVDQAKTAKKKQLQLNLEALDYISSISVRNMVLWLRDAVTRYPEAEIVFTEVSSHVYRQLLLVGSLLPLQLKIASFQVPFYCDKCEIETQKLVQASQVLPAGDDYEKAVEPAPVCEKCQVQMQPDVNLEEYLKIIK